uniref:Uncharacterized protein n=1 Tax=Panagrolaimus sp. JU765 TaxID=591449 RepID=A0AC34RPQ8_9BILA
MKEKLIFLFSAFEFPRINFNYNLKPHRFIYGAGLQWNQNNLVGLTKVDVQTRKTITWNRDNLEQIAAEPIFVPKPDGQLEDDGRILKTKICMPPIFQE